MNVYLLSFVLEQVSHAVVDWADTDWGNNWMWGSSFTNQEAFGRPESDRADIGFMYSIRPTVFFGVWLKVSNRTINWHGPRARKARLQKGSKASAFFMNLTSLSSSSLQLFTGNLQGNRWTQWKTVSPTWNTCSVNRLMTVFYFMVQGMTVGITGNVCWWNRGPTGKQVNTGKNCFTNSLFVLQWGSQIQGTKPLKSSTCNTYIRSSFVVFSQKIPNPLPYFSTLSLFLQYTVTNEPLYTKCCMSMSLKI